MTLLPYLHPQTYTGGGVIAILSFSLYYDTLGASSCPASAGSGKHLPHLAPAARSKADGWTCTLRGRGRGACNCPLLPAWGQVLSHIQLDFSPLTATRTRTSLTRTRTRTALPDPARGIVPTTLDPVCGIAPDRTTSTTTHTRTRTRTRTHTAHP
ncbi:hypothetical protein K438DRAFT_1991208 [Mycena galopus ATCC 62051]|nr:hypothetical protein K438DRAFT_1991208 [Mycena galopus ATCC 62051]